MGLDSPKQNRRFDQRLQKYMAACGVGSRRACEEIIAAGRVSVNGRIVAAQGVCVNPAVDEVLLDNRPLACQPKIVLLLNKPRDVLCTSDDPSGRRTVFTLLPAFRERVYTIGRLDRNSEGLLLITNDGDLAFALTHPRHGIEKIYCVWTEQAIAPPVIRQLRQGVFSRGELLRALEIQPVEAVRGQWCYRIRLNEGRNRHIRRMLEAVGIAVRRLKRTALASLTLGALRSGQWRFLDEMEVKRLRSCAVVNLNAPKEGKQCVRQHC